MMKALTFYAICFPVHRYILISQTRGLNLSPDIYKSYFDYRRQLPKREGRRGFWRGSLSSTVYFCLFSFSFAAIRNSINYPLLIVCKAESPAFQLGQRIATFFSLLFIGLFTYPIERVSVLLSCDTTPKTELKKYSSSYDCIKKIYKKTGYRGFYQGFGLYSLSCGVFSALYDSLVGMMLEETDTFMTTLQKIAVAGGISFYIAYPVEVMRKRRIVGDGVGYKKELARVIPQAKQIWNSEGVKGFYRGILAHALHKIYFLTVWIISLHTAS